ncbi:SARM1 [Cordylochernes scorpioides]|uniref:SARM1 n=1 Tax=Cordylochernes scorpioides TaxID=51811 RepID=A0ABY6L938_9ARAC|nr:SARM1 [Cordylochernes scorpioides]
MATTGSPRPDKRPLLGKLTKLAGSADSGSPLSPKLTAMKRFHSQEQSEVRNFSRSQSTSSSSSSQVYCRTNSRERLLEEEPTEAITFEEKRTTSAASKKTISSDGKSTEHTMATNTEMKRLQKGDDSYEAKLCANVARERVAENGVSREKTAATRQEQHQLKVGDTVQTHNVNAQATSDKLKDKDFSSEKLAMAKAEENIITSQNILQQRTRNVQSAQNFTLASKGMTVTTGSAQKSAFFNDAPNFSTPINSTVYLAITQGVDDDIKFLTSSDPSKEASGAKERFTNRLSTCVENLETAESLEEASLLMNGMAEMMQKVWNVPNLGQDLVGSMKNVFQEKGGLGLALRHLGSNNPEIQLSSARLLEQILAMAAEGGLRQEELRDVVAGATGCCSKKSVSHARAGTALLERLCQQSEETCSSLIKLGGLEAIMLDCRRDDTETLLHCAKTLVNLALYGGPENQHLMVRQQSLLWLFYLASHNDLIVKYFACLAIAVLGANKELEAPVLKSKNLSLVEKFVEKVDVEEVHALLAQSQGRGWLARLVPALESSLEASQSMAALHFALEALLRPGDTKVFEEIEAVNALRKVASCPNGVASRLAARALHTLGLTVPRALSQQVPLWSEDDVAEWVKQIGFGSFAPAFLGSRVDGDLLLQLDEEMLRHDIGVSNGILRRRFLRELNHLKRRCDYSSCEGSELSQALQSLGVEFPQYTYSLLQRGVRPEWLRFVTEDQLALECGVINSIHRVRILQALRGPLDPSDWSVGTWTVHPAGGRTITFSRQGVGQT